MNFAFTDDQILLKNSARALLEEHCKPEHVRAMQDDARGYGEALWGEMAKLGWLGLPFPEQYGGAGLGLVELALLHEEMGRVAYPGPFLASVVLGGLPLLLGGSAAQKEKWLPAIASGRARLTAAFQEESLDWDPASVATTAARAGAGWTLSGVKRFVPWAHAADAVLVPARTPEGVSLFLVDPKAAGVTLHPTTGMDLTTRWSEMTLGGVTVGADALVGSAGGGAALLDSTLRRAAVCASAEMLGTARRALDMAVGYAKVREQFGRTIGTFQAVKHHAANMLVNAEQTTAATWDAARADDHRPGPRPSRRRTRARDGRAPLLTGKASCDERAGRRHPGQSGGQEVRLHAGAAGVTARRRRRSELPVLRSGPSEAASPDGLHEQKGTVSDPCPICGRPSPSCRTRRSSSACTRPSRRSPRRTAWRSRSSRSSSRTGRGSCSSGSSPSPASGW